MIIRDPLFRLTLIFLFGFLFFQTLYYAQSILIPLGFAVLLSLLVLPLCNILEKWHFPRGLAVFLCLFIVVVTISGLVFLFSTQVINLAKDFPTYMDQLQIKIDEAQHLIERRFKISPEDQLTYIESRATQLLQNSGQFLTNFFLATTGTLVDFSLVLLYTFLLLYLRDRFKNFIMKVTEEKDQENTKKILGQSGLVTAKYLSGVFTVVAILAVLNSAGLMIIGLPHPIFFGSLAAALNVIPYIGVFAGSAFAVIMAIIAMESIWSAVAVLVLFVAIQSFESNFLTPKIVGGKIQINPLATILALIIGGSLWGIAGMVLFLPFLGVLKIVLDNVKPLQPYGYLIGEYKEAGKKESTISFLKRLYKRKKDNKK
jgi:predicted PurR-regulated permease PerM